MRRLYFVILLGVLVLVMGFSGVLAQVDTSDWYWDAELGLYITWDDEYAVYYLYDPTEESIWAFEPSSNLYYVYDPDDEEFYEVGYVDAGGGVVETEGSYGSGYTYEDEMDPLTYQATVNIMQMNHEMIMNGIDTMTGSGDYYGYDYDGGYDY
ncbi:hypothetical protein KAU45_03035 [bacterium]|nr:hypothetical protein [bacterium]